MLPARLPWSFARILQTLIVTNGGGVGEVGLNVLVGVDGERCAATPALAARSRLAKVEEPRREGDAVDAQVDGPRYPRYDTWCRAVR